MPLRQRPARQRPFTRVGQTVLLALGIAMLGAGATLWALVETNAFTSHSQAFDAVYAGFVLLMVGTVLILAAFVQWVVTADGT